MRLKTPSTTFLFTGGIFLFVSLVCCPTAKADLTYYLYAEEEEQNNQEEATVLVLRSIGSLPLDKSAFSTAGDACPEMVWEAGGVNPKYLCAGAAHPGSSSKLALSPNANDSIAATSSATSTTDNSNNAAFFPIAPSDAFSEATNSFLPFKYSAFQRSRGTPSGLLAWRNSLVVDLEVATNENQPQFLDAVSMGKDASKDEFNSLTLAAHEDGELLGEWYLLSSRGGDPILDGGKISFVKGKPPATTHKSIHDMNSTGNGEALATTNDASISSQQEQQSTKTNDTCRSITDVICDDENNDRYGTLCSLAMQVGLDTMLSFLNGNLFTLYAPTNDGFSRAFMDRNPSLLSGHDLTKLILNHLIVSETSEMTLTQSESINAANVNANNPPKEALRYENMVCGTKIEMASGQITKIGCDTNSEVAYVVGSGNGVGFRPKFLEVDQQACNGVIHTVDFAVLPTSQQQIHSNLHHVHQAGVVNIEGGSINTANQNTITNAASLQAIPQINTNELDQTEIMSFFMQTKEDLLEESGPLINPNLSAPTIIVENTPKMSITNVANARVSEPEPKDPKTTTATTITNTDFDVNSKSEPDRKEYDNNAEQNGIDTELGGFHSFFSRKRPGNLRRR